MHENLGTLYEQAEDWAKAAKTLCKIPFNGVQINMTAEDKLGAFVEIAELFLRYRNSLEAGTYINKALHELTQIQSPLERGEVTTRAIRLCLLAISGLSDRLLAFAAAPLVRAAAQGAA